MNEHEQRIREAIRHHDDCYTLCEIDGVKRDDLRLLLADLDAARERCARLEKSLAVCMHGRGVMLAKQEARDGE